MIHHKNYLLYKDATCQFLAKWFHWCYCFLFSVLFSIAFILLLSLHILPSVAFSLAFLPSYFSWLCCSFSPLTAAFSGCFFGLFCPVLLGGGFLAHCRAPISSDWFFVWHSLRPSSTQLLVRNRTGFCSHWAHFSPEYIFLQIVLQSPTLLFSHVVLFFLVVCRVLFSLSASSLSQIK